MTNKYNFRRIWAVKGADNGYDVMGNSLSRKVEIITCFAFSMASYVNSQDLTGN